MKFRKVEIQAFKAYNDVKDGTFDFTTKSNSVADLISIFAPNGFGKTSFLDAVEWGFTNNISRMMTPDKDNLNDAITDDSNYNLANRDSLQEHKEGYVRLHVTSETKPIERRISDPNHSLRPIQRNFRQKENKADEKRQFFHEVFLSQERITSFLKEDDASDRYRKFIRSFGDFRMDNKYKVLAELINLNNQKIERLKHDYEIVETLVNQISSIFLLTDNLTDEKFHPLSIQEYLKSAQNKIRAEQIFLSSEVAPRLAQEREALSAYIEKQIASFFYAKLINKLYRKLDPHPKCKEITFKCDFNEDRPQLNIFVDSENDEPPITPSFYFSAAQLNILSLSIFLAKALRVKDNDGNPVDCIFIDDPVQYMDSINILSTIDLLRSIVVNLRKQIIIITHDENFHKLLQKKIPPEKFNAKYIEFETFGKVKQG